MTTNEILNIPEVVERLLVAAKTVCSRAQRVVSSVLEVRGKWRIRRAHLDEWLDGQRAPARPWK